MTKELPETFDRPWVLLCEGEGDKKFFHKLITYYQIHPGHFTICFPSRDQDDAGGNGKFASWLSLRRKAPTFRQNVRAVLIVSDNDDKPLPQSFQAIQRAISGTDFPSPRQEQVPEKKDGFPSITVLMVPVGENGNLETLCVRAALQKWELAEALDLYTQAAPASNWESRKQAKMQMQCILAATCETKPDTSLAHHWQEREEFHIPINSDVFIPIAEFLIGFDRLLAG